MEKIYSKPSLAFYVIISFSSISLSMLERKYFLLQCIFRLQIMILVTIWKFCGRTFLSEKQRNVIAP